MNAAPKKPNLLYQLRIAIRTLNYALSTEKTYVHWAKSYIIYHNKRHPKEMGSKEVSDYLSYLESIPCNSKPSLVCNRIFIQTHLE